MQLVLSPMLDSEMFRTTLLSLRDEAVSERSRRVRYAKTCQVKIIIPVMTWELKISHFHR